MKKINSCDQKLNYLETFSNIDIERKIPFGFLIVFCSREIEIETSLNFQKWKSKNEIVSKYSLNIHD